MQHYYILHWSKKTCLHLFSEKYKLRSEETAYNFVTCYLQAQNASDTIGKQLNTAWYIKIELDRILNMK